MKNILSFAGRDDLTWTQPKALKQAFELRAGEDVVGTLEFRNSFGSFATGESADGRWTFKRQGFFRPIVTVRAAGSETDLAVFHNRTWTGGGTIDFPDGHHLLVSSNFWHTKFDIATETDSPLVSFRRMSGAFHWSSGITIHAAAAGVPELPWLVMLGWYVKVLMHRDAAATAVIAAS
jgi:hypothetical protein